MTVERSINAVLYSIVLLRAVACYVPTCATDRDCSAFRGEVCWLLYSGCAAECMCQPKYYTTDERGKCIPLKLGNQMCDSTSKCIEGMHCLQGNCQCKMGQLSSEGRFCLQEKHKLLGQPCTKDDICLHYSATKESYIKEYIVCDENCICEPGYKQQHNTCTTWLIGEEGCLKNYHCAGGAICSKERKCVCPQGYIPLQRHKCAKDGATINIKQGKICDEKGETGYCAYGLVCFQCSNEKVQRCVRYMDSMKSRYVSGASSLKGSSPAFSLVTLTLVFILMIF